MLCFYMMFWSWQFISVEMGVVLPVVGLVSANSIAGTMQHIYIQVVCSCWCWEGWCMDSQ